jgi:hypothetical protein
MNSVGLWLVKTQTVGTGVSSVTVTGAFSADYDNYLVTMTGGVGNNNTNLRLVLGSASANYYSQLIYASYAGTVALANVADNNAARWTWVGWADGNLASARLNLYNPFLTTRTFLAVQYADATNAGTVNGILGDNTSYSSFTISPAAGTLTGGTIRVYGYRN